MQIVLDESYFSSYTNSNLVSAQQKRKSNLKLISQFCALLPKTKQRNDDKNKIKFKINFIHDRKFLGKFEAAIARKREREKKFIQK
jgi:dTDP-D-glucose 4,6-dehydratase